MPDSCCAYGCTNRREENGDRAFYRFPRGKKEEQQELRKKWVQACRRENWSEQQINNARICGDNFITGKCLCQYKRRYFRCSSRCYC